MIGAEGQVLKIVRKLKLADEETLSRKMAVSSKYVIEICKCLVKSGYLSETPKGYTLTSEGESAASPVRIKYRERSLL